MLCKGQQWPWGLWGQRRGVNGFSLAAAVLLPALGTAAGLDKGKRGAGSRTKAEPYSACVARSSLRNKS